MAEFQMIIKDLERLCDTYRSLGKCGTDECPLYCENLCYARQMVHVHGDDAGGLEDVVMKWAEEHPEPVYPTFREWLISIGIIGQMSTHSVIADKLAMTPIPADIAEKLGIEPNEN